MSLELLAPAGNMEKLKIAIAYGANAVYLGGDRFGLRAAAGNFSMEEIKEAVVYAHSRNVRVYVTANIIPHNDDFLGVKDYLIALIDQGVDALIVSDPGVIELIKELDCDIEIHLSTQANAVNHYAARFWYKQGVKRIVVGRELSLQEIKEIRENIPMDMEIEAFVHGAMCISYSGRCLLSNFMTGRDANRGDCAQACRWKYSLVEEKRPGEYYPVYEDDKGSYIFNSKDLCMIEHINELIDCGVVSFKIEGRMKSSFYVATVVKAYREAIDKTLNGESYDADYLLSELTTASYRGFTKGFYFDKPKSDAQTYDKAIYIRNYDFVAMVLEYDDSTKTAVLEQRNRFFLGEELEVLSPFGPIKSIVIENLEDDLGNQIDVAPHPQQMVKIKTSIELAPFDMLRKRKDD